jgi:hypothetical protein
MHAPLGRGGTVASHVCLLPVHEPRLVKTSDGRAAKVDHVHWASHADAVLMPWPSAVRTAVRLLHRCCERLDVPRSVVDDAATLLGRMVGAGLEWTREPLRIDVDVDGCVVHVRMAATASAMAELDPLLALTDASRWVSADPVLRECTVTETDSAIELFASVRPSPLTADA